jgi:hypothetical protein
VITAAVLLTLYALWVNQRARRPQEKTEIPT